MIEANLLVLIHFLAKPTPTLILNSLHCALPTKPFTTLLSALNSLPIFSKSTSESYVLFILI
jgi:hypothetical protein